MDARTLADVQRRFWIDPDRVEFMAQYRTADGRWSVYVLSATGPARTANVQVPSGMFASAAEIAASLRS